MATAPRAAAGRARARNHFIGAVCLFLARRSGPCPRRRSVPAGIRRCSPASTGPESSVATGDVPVEGPTQVPHGTRGCGHLVAADAAGTPSGYAADMPEQNMVPGVITVWSDISCPWATMALHTLRGRAAELDVTLEVDHRVFPLELINAEPSPQPAHDAEVAQIAAVRADLGWAAWSGPSWAYPVTTLPALQAVQAAKIQGLRAADALDAALRRAFYVEHRMISLVPVIEEIAQECPAVDAERLGDALRA